MVYIEDTRQQAGKHNNVHQYFEAKGDTLLRSKMLVGDYMRANNGSIAVDTKSGVLELMSDVFKQHERFRTELETAQQAGIQLYILTEELLPNGRLSDWVSPKFSRFGARKGRAITYQSPSKLRKALVTLSERYGVQFLFCSPERTGEYIEALLAGQLLHGQHSLPSGWMLTE